MGLPPAFHRQQALLVVSFCFCLTFWDSFKNAGRSVSNQPSQSGFHVGLGGQGTLHVAAAEAAGAHIQAPGLTVYQHAHALNVGSPDAVGLAVGVAYIVAAHRALFTNLTKFAHHYTS